MEPNINDPLGQQLVRPAKRGSGWITFLRVVIWGIVVLLLPLGLTFLASSRRAIAYADGTQQGLENWGRAFFWLGLILGVGNLIWGVARWGLRWRREHWTPGRVIGKLVGGGVWRALVFMPLVAVVLLFFAPLVRGWIMQKTLADAEARLFDAGAQIVTDYKSGKLTADEYVNYTIDAVYAPSQLPEKYQGAGTTMTPDLLRIVDEHFGELSRETIERALEIATLANVKFGTDASGNVAQQEPDLWARLRNWGLGVQNTYAYTKNVKTLNKAKLSGRGRFVIFYTDTGEDAISDADAERLGQMLEKIIDGYEQTLGLTYTYELYPMLYPASRTSAVLMKEVLKNSGIDENITDTAMAVYVANPYPEDNGILASYAGKQFADVLTSVLVKLGGMMGEETAKFYSTTPAYPFVNILPQNVHDTSLSLVTAHELGHHFASSYCYSHSGQACSTNDFVAETLPNWAAVNVIPANEQASDNVITGHYDNYIRPGTCYPIDETVPEPGGEHSCHKSGSIVGYPAFAFLENYYQVVPNGQEHIFAALESDNALSSLYGAAGQQKFKQVMVQLAERNLTQEGYGGRSSLKSKQMPRGEELACSDFCETAYFVSRAAMRYFYFPLEEYKNANLKIMAGEEMAISVLGKQDGKWRVIEQAGNTLNFQIKEEFGYETIAVAVTNYSIQEEGEVRLEIKAGEMAEVIEETDEPLLPGGQGMFDILGTNCLGINFDSILDLPAQLVRLVSQLDEEQDYEEVIAGLEQQSTESKAQLTYHYAVICVNQLKPGLDFQTTRAKLKMHSGLNFELMNIRDGQDELSMFMSYDLLTNEGKIYMMVQSAGEAQLLTARLLRKAQ